MRRPRGVKSIETKHYEERDAFFRGLHNLDRRSFLKVSIAAAAAAAANGIVQNLHAVRLPNLHPHFGRLTLGQSAFQLRPVQTQLRAHR